LGGHPIDIPTLLLRKGCRNALFYASEGRKINKTHKIQTRPDGNLQSAIPSKYSHL